MSNLHVMLSPDGHWDVKDAEDGEVISHHEARDDALRAATQLARERDGAEVRVHEVEGEIELRREVAADGGIEEREGVAGGAGEETGEGDADLGGGSRS